MRTIGWPNMPINGLPSVQKADTTDYEIGWA